MNKPFELRKEQIILDLKAKDRYSAFEEMLAYLVKLGDIPFTSQHTILDKLKSREAQTTFATGKNIAIPHINGVKIKNCTLLYARSNDGIDFGSCDCGLVHHLFLALIPEEEKCGWLKTLSMMSRAFSDGKLRESLMSVDDSCEAQVYLNEKLSNST